MPEVPHRNMQYALKFRWIEGNAICVGFFRVRDHSYGFTTRMDKVSRKCLLWQLITWSAFAELPLEEIDVDVFWKQLRREFAQWLSVPAPAWEWNELL